MQRAVVEKSWQRWLRQLLSSGEKEECAMAQEIKRPDMGAVASRYRDPFAEMRAEMDRVFDSFSRARFLWPAKFAQDDDGREGRAGSERSRE